MKQGAQHHPRGKACAGCGRKTVLRETDGLCPRCAPDTTVADLDLWSPPPDEEETIHTTIPADEARRRYGHLDVDVEDTNERGWTIIRGPDVEAVLADLMSRDPMLGET